MKQTYTTKLDSLLDLRLERVIDVPKDLVWKAWTIPEYLKEWFTPAPWKTVECRVDLRPGGEFYTLMRSPDGHDNPLNGCFLEIVENERLVWTDALQAGYRPALHPFMTGVIALETSGSGTKYTATAIHKDQETRKRHDEMGFHEGWGKALDQLIAFVKKELV